MKRLCEKVVFVSVSRVFGALLCGLFAFVLFSCDKEVELTKVDYNTLVTLQSDSLTIIESQNGIKKMHVFARTMERYEKAKEPYMEFRKGIEVTTYNDSTGLVESTLVANYAILLERQSLWEAKGDVVATNAEGQRLETQQLFWNQKTEKIYSNVDSKLTQGTDVIVGVGFEAEQDLSNFVFRRPRGKVAVDVEPTDEEEESEVPAVSGKEKPVAPVTPTAKEPEFKRDVKQRSPARL